MLPTLLSSTPDIYLFVVSHSFSCLACSHFEPLFSIMCLLILHMECEHKWLYIMVGSLLGVMLWAKNKRNHLVTLKMYKNQISLRKPMNCKTNQGTSLLLLSCRNLLESMVCGYEKYGNMQWWSLMDMLLSKKSKHLIQGKKLINQHLVCKYSLPWWLVWKGQMLNLDLSPSVF